jgi:hypothetical protein
MRELFRNIIDSKFEFSLSILALITTLVSQYAIFRHKRKALKQSIKVKFKKGGNDIKIEVGDPNDIKIDDILAKFDDIIAKEKKTTRGNNQFSE